MSNGIIPFLSSIVQNFYKLNSKLKKHQFTNCEHVGHNLGYWILLVFKSIYSLIWMISSNILQRWRWEELRTYSSLAYARSDARLWVRWQSLPIWWRRRRWRFRSIGCNSKSKTTWYVNAFSSHLKYDLANQSEPKETKRKTREPKKKREKREKKEGENEGTNFIH